MRRDAGGNALVPGVNADVVDIVKGLAEAKACGYDDGVAQMVALYALQRHQRGEEDGAERTWRRYYPRDLTSWKRILSAALVDGAEKSKQDAAIMDALRGKD